jgi:hypothetical protein
MSDYDDDILLWSERLAGLLRRRAAGHPVNDAEIDWPNVAEEIESVGNEQLHAIEAFLVQARDAPHWRGGAEITRRCG